MSDKTIKQEIQENGFTASGITPFKCGGCNATVTSFCPGDHSGCPNDFAAIRVAVFGSDITSTVERK